MNKNILSIIIGISFLFLISSVKKEHVKYTTASLDLPGTSNESKCFSSNVIGKMK